MDLVEQHRRDAGKFGIGLDARQEHAVRHDDRRACPCRLCCRAALHSRSSGPASAGPPAMNSAAARAARRRGTSSSTWPRHHSSPEGLGPPCVVLPAPGGATSSTGILPASAASKSAKQPVDRQPTHGGPGGHANITLRRAGPGLRSRSADREWSCLGVCDDFLGK